MAKCMQCGGPMRRAKVGAIVSDDPTKKEVRQAMRKDRKIDREDKKFMKQYEKQKAEELMKSKRFKKGGITQDIVGMPGYNATLYPTSFKTGGTAKLKKASAGMPVKPGTTSTPGANKKAADKATMMNPANKYAKGGSSKTKKFAALAPPYDKATFADKIVGAKKKMAMGGPAPSSGLTDKKKSAVAKKASAGKDIGKPGKGFAKLAASAGGGDKGKRIAAAAMWKNIKRG